MSSKISIIIPTYNGSETLPQTLESVLRQEYQNYEIIVVDDGSIDSTVKIVKSLAPSAKIIQQQNRGTLAARQIGVEEAEGNLIAFLDQDDLWFKESLQTELEIMEEHPDVGLVFANMGAIDDNGKSLGFNVVPPDKCYTPSWEELLLLHPIANSTALFRKSVVEKIGPLDPNFGFSGALGDTDTFVRMSEVAKIYFLNKRIGNYRWSESRPGRLVSFLDNLQVYAKKYWNHPRLKLKENVGIRTNFVRTCCNYAIHIYRLLLKQYNGKVPNELLIRLNEHNTAMEDLFGDFYRTNIGLRSLDYLGTHDFPGDGLKVLLFLYLLRPDLQKAFPQVIDGDLEMLVVWGAQVAGGQIHDGDVEILRQFSSELETAASTGNYGLALPGINGKDGTANGYRSFPKSKDFPNIIRIKSKVHISMELIANRMFPLETKRRRLFTPLLKGIKVLLTEGWKSFGRKSILFMGQVIPAVGDRVKTSYRVISSRFSRRGHLDDNNITKSKLGILLSDMDVKFTFQKFDSPLVAILVSADENQQHTYECLESIAAHSRVPFRLFVTHSKAMTEQLDFLTKLEHVTVIDDVIDSKGKSGYHDLVLDRLASEKYILFLTNNSMVTSGYLERMVEILENNDGCGAVTCKMVDLSGRLLEAGGIIEDNGSLVSCGLGDSPDKPEYSYVRQVHFGSPGCFLIRRGLLEDICSNHKFTLPDVDFFKLITDSGYSILYQPAAIVLSHNFGRSDRRNKARLLLKQNTNNSFDLLTARNIKKSTKILVIDDYIPAIRYGSGFPRLYKMLTCLSDLNYLTTFFPVGNPVKVQPETSELQQKGVEVFWGSQVKFDEFAQSRAGYYDAVLISRPHVFEKIYPTVIRTWPKAAILYDAEALFYARDIVMAEIAGVAMQALEKTRIARKEMELVEKADVVISVSQKTKDIMLKNSSQRNIEVWEHIQDVPGSTVSFGQRQGLLHFGSFFAGPGSPNEDAVLYFVREVLPEIRQTLPCTLYVVGTSPTPAVLKLAGQDIEVAGYVDHPKTYFDMCRVNVVPTRIFATGTPLKLIEAMSYGIPSVVNGPIARHLGLVDGKEVLVADTNREFAAKVVQLYSDESLWQSLHRNSIKYITENYSYDKMRRRLDTAIKSGLEIKSKKALSTKATIR